MFAQQRDIGQTVATQRQREREIEIEHDLGRIMPRGRLTPRRQHRRQRPIHTHLPIVSSSSTPPPCGTTPDPAASTGQAGRTHYSS